MPKLGAKNFVEGRLKEYEEKIDQELYRDLAHSWYNFPCIKNTTTKYWSMYSQRYLTKENSSCEACLERGLVGFGGISMASWRLFRKMTRRFPRTVANIWIHPWVKMGACGGKKSYRVRNNRDYRREVRTTERRALMEDEEIPFPIYKKSVLWEMW
jgi:hypothetical protein